MIESREAAQDTKSKISLHGQHHKLADAHEQLEILEHSQSDKFVLIPFEQKLRESGLYPLNPTGIEIFQVNLGKMCNQTCKHCHVDAGPDRKEIMTRNTMMECLEVLKNNPSFRTVDITGGAPEMNPDFRWFVEQIKEISPSLHIIVRCNLTIIVSNKKYQSSVKKDVDWGLGDQVTGWPCLKFSLTEPQYFLYGYKASTALNANSFVGYAEADLKGTGTVTLGFSIRGKQDSDTKQMVVETQIKEAEGKADEAAP